MSFSHEKLDVYRLTLEYVAWAFKTAHSLTCEYRHSRDQWLRAAQSIPLNIADGNRKIEGADRRRFFEIARGSAYECAAIQDVLTACEGLSSADNKKAKAMLDRISAMLTKLGKRSYTASEDRAEYVIDSASEGERDEDTAVAIGEQF